MNYYMNQKGFANIALVLVIIAIVAIGGYFAFFKKSSTLTNNLPQPTDRAQQTTPVATSNIPATLLQQTPKCENLPSMRTALKQAFPDDPFIETSRCISIYKKVDITGDGVPEVLVNLGYGGATNDRFTLMRIENNKPIVSLFKEKGGKVSVLDFSIGSGGAGRYEMTAEMLANKNAIYLANYSKYGDGEDHCLAEAYQWDSQTKIFEYNTALSNEVQRDYCRKSGF